MAKMVKIIKKKDEYSMEYEVGDVLKVDSTWYGGVTVLGKTGVPVSIDKDEYEEVQDISEPEKAEPTSIEEGLRPAGQGVSTEAFDHLKEIKDEVRGAVKDLLAVAGLEPGDALVVGCSSSEVANMRIGSFSSEEIGKCIAGAILDELKDTGVYMAAQCCEHLNRAIIVEKEYAKANRIPIVNVVPQLKAGGSFATAAYADMKEPVAIEAIQAARIIEKTVDEEVTVMFEYPFMNDIMRIVKEEEPEILNQSYDMDCSMTLRIRRSMMAKLRARLEKVETARILDEEENH